MAKKSFEDNMMRLEQIVAALEGGEVKLDESLKLFEEGTALVTACSRLLDSAEQKVVQLSKGPDGAPIETPFASEE